MSATRSPHASNPATKPHLLVISSNLSLLRGHYESVLTALAAAGVRVSIRYVKQKWLAADDFKRLLEEAGVEASVEPLPRTAKDPLEMFALRLRQLGNVLRYLHRDYVGRDRLRDRAFDDAPAGVQRWARRIARLGPRLGPKLAALVARLERTLPPSRSAAALIAAEQPDAVVATPVIRVPELVAYLKAAQLHGVTTASWIESWDNLTNKGLHHFTPDRVFVWNASQAGELERYHGVSREHVCITGAQTFDHWFAGDVPSERAAFCTGLGVDPERPVILYLTSSRQICPDEPDFFVRWLGSVRTSGDSLLQSATILVRPHPTVVDSWLERGFEREAGVVMSPSTRRDAINSDGFRRNYRDELHHATLAFGLNTSGLIDAAIFGKPVCTVELPELRDSQRGTVHFHHLVEGDPALLRTAPTLEDHVAALAELVRRDPYVRDERSARFVATFVRPHGLDVAPAQVFFEEMLRLCHQRSHLRRPSSAGRLAGWTLARAAFILGAPLEERPLERILPHVGASAAAAFLLLRRVVRRGPVAVLRRARRAGRAAVTSARRR